MNRSASGITVVIPVRDRPRAVVRALESVLAQSRPADAIVVVDDGSTPALVLPEAFRVRADIRVVRNETGQGASEARNRGIAESRSAIIAFLDSDDAYLPGHLAAIEASFREEPDAAFVCARAFLSDDALVPFQAMGRRGGRITHRDLLEYGNVAGTTSAIAARRDVLLAVGGFPPIASLQDWALLLALSQHGDGFGTREPTILYRSPRLTRDPGITKHFGMHEPSWSYVFDTFDFDRTAQTRRTRDELRPLVLAINGRRLAAVGMAARNARSYGPSRWVAKAMLAAIVGRRAYGALLAARVRLLAARQRRR